jgi:transposase
MIGFLTHCVAMPQVQLPIFPADCTFITSDLAFERRDGQVFYFNGHMPVFSHAADDLASFRLFTTQLIVNGSATQAQVSRAFGVPLITVKRMCKKLREQGAKGFFAPPPPAKGHKLTPELLAQAQALLNEGLSISEVGAQLGVLPNTVHKAIAYGRLQKKERPARRP